MITFDRAQLENRDGQTWLLVHPIAASLFDARKFVREIKERNYDIDPKPHYEKRSPSANSYCWVLCDRIAEAIRSTKEDVYRELIKRVGVFTFVGVHVNEVRRYADWWKRRGEGWFCEMMETTGEWVTVQCWVGSSEYNTKEMSRLLDEAIDEAKGLGLETITPDEKARMLDLWGGK